MTEITFRGEVIYDGKASYFFERMENDPEFRAAYDAARQRESDQMDAEMAACPYVTCTCGHHED